MSKSESARNYGEGKRNYSLALADSPGGRRRCYQGGNTDHCQDHHARNELGVRFSIEGCTGVCIFLGRENQDYRGGCYIYY